MTTTLGAAFIANANTKDVLFCTSTDGTHWSNNVPVHQFSKTTPSVAFFDFKFWVAFVDNTTNNNLLICSSPDGVTWTPLTAVGQLSKSPPSLVVFKNGLWLAFLAANTSNEILICSSPDGTNWAGSTPVGQLSKTAPALTVFNNRLWMAFVETVAANDVSVCSSADGRSWSTNTRVGQLSKTAPSLAVFNNKLWLAFVANDNTNGILVCSSADGTHWSSNTPVKQTSKDAPSLAVLNGRLCLTFIANDNANQVLVCSSADGINWSNNTQMGQFSNFAPAVTAAALTAGTVRPLYEVLTVVYAPPGTKGGNSKSTVTYGNGTSAGATTSISSSFQAGVDVSATVGGATQFAPSATSDVSFSDTKTDSSSVEIKKSQNYSLTVQGPAEDGIDHSEDQFILWLNPLVSVAIDPSGKMQYSMGVDGNVANLQLVRVKDLQNPASMLPQLKQILSRAGLTEADYASILSTNPFTSANAAIDPKRFVPIQYFTYQPPGADTPQDPPNVNLYTQTTTTTNTNTQEAKVQYGVKVSVSAGIANVVKLTVAGSMQWTNTSSTGTSSSALLSATVVVGGPSLGYTGPIDVVIYWDTVFNTFMFAFPAEPAIASGTFIDIEGRPVANTPIALVVGTHTVRTFTGPNGAYRFYGAPTGPGKISVDGQDFAVSVGPNAPKPVLKLAAGARPPVKVQKA